MGAALRSKLSLLAAVCMSCGLGVGCSTPREPPRFVAPVPQAAPSCLEKPALDPLVTEWPASAKAHLQSVLVLQPVAVRYDGCELHIVEECRLSGQYVFRQTPLTRDALAIESADELERELPVGGFSLRGELEHNGSLLLETATAGQFQLARPDVNAPDAGPCTEATHLVTSIDVGSFRLFGRGRAAAVAAVDIGFQAGARSERSEELLREAGLVEACSANTETAPAKQCASPLRLNLAPLRREVPATQIERARRAGEVFVTIPRVEGSDAPWALHDAAGAALCPLPCARWLRPDSGYSLVRSDGAARARETIPISGGFPVAPGESAIAVVRGERGAPTVSRVAFWAVGAPSLVFGGLLSLAGGLAWLNSDSSEDSGLGMLGVGLGVTAVGAGLYGWYRYSHEASFDVQRHPRSRKPAPPATSGTQVGPLFVRGSF